MRSFFDDWRRNTGIALLAITCILTAGWVCSGFGGLRYSFGFFGWYFLTRSGAISTISDDWTSSTGTHFSLPYPVIVLPMLSLSVRLLLTKPQTLSQTTPNQRSNHVGDMKLLFQRGCFLLGIVFLCMIPLGMVLQMTGRGQMEQSYLGEIILAWFCFAIMSHRIEGSSNEQTNRPQNAPQID
jgi:hypothetical protein